MFLEMGGKLVPLRGTNHIEVVNVVGPLLFFREHEGRILQPFTVDRGKGTPLSVGFVKIGQLVPENSCLELIEARIKPFYLMGVLCFLPIISKGCYLFIYLLAVRRNPSTITEAA